MSMFAELTFFAGGIMAWLAVGLIAGWLAGRILKGAGYGLIRHLLVGLIGAFIAGLSFGLVNPSAEGFWPSTVVAFLGACLLIFIVRLLAVKRKAK